MFVIKGEMLLLDVNSQYTLVCFQIQDTHIWGGGEGGARRGVGPFL